MGFGLMIQFIAYFDTACNYTLLTAARTAQKTSSIIAVFSVAMETCLFVELSNGCCVAACFVAIS
jgi:hypothetical protein